MSNMSTEPPLYNMQEEYSNNSETINATQYETLDGLNQRYANALIPVSILLGLFAVVGILGNILVLVVFTFSSQYKNNNFRIFVISLALIDLITCISLIPAEIAKMRSHFSFPDATPCKVKCFFNTFGTAAAANTLLVIAIDRFRKVCQPLKRQIVPSQAIKLLFFVAFVSFLMCVPAPVLCGIITANKTNIYNTTTTVYMCTAEKKFQKSVWRWLYKSTLTLCLLVISVALIVMYSMIGWTVIRHWKTRSAGSTVKFETNKSDEVSDRVEVDKLTDDCFSPEDMKTLTCNPENGKQVQGKCDKKDGKIRQHAQKFSSLSLSSSSMRRNMIRRDSEMRKGSDSSFRTYSLRRRSSTGTARKLPYKTLIWIILTFVFIFTYFLYAILSFIVPNVYKMSPGRFTIYSLFYRLYFINNAINPVVYGLLDIRFQNSCKRLLTAIKRGACKSMCCN